MSVRAYKVKKVEYADSPTFNLWHCHEELATVLDINQQLNEDGCGYIEISKETIKEAIKETGDVKLVEELQEILADFDNGEEFIQYNCF